MPQDIREAHTGAYTRRSEKRFHLELKTTNNYDFDRLDRSEK